MLRACRPPTRGCRGQRCDAADANAVEREDARGPCVGRQAAPGASGCAPRRLPSSRRTRQRLAIARPLGRVGNRRDLGRPRR